MDGAELRVNKVANSNMLDCCFAHTINFKINTVKQKIKNFFYFRLFT